MKKIILRALAICLALVCIATGAFASVSATPNQRLPFRTGPSTDYTEIFTLPDTTQLTAYEYEQGSGVTWVLVEFVYKGEVYRGYTGLKRMTVNGSIPWAQHQYQTVFASAAETIYAAPSINAAVRGTLNYGMKVSLLRLDGSYAYIEYTDHSGKLSRGWTPSWALNISSNSSGPSSGGIFVTPNTVVTGDAYIPMYVDLAAPMYNQPAYAETAVRLIPQYAQVLVYGELYCGFSIVEYNGYVGYVPSHFLCYYD